MSDRIREFREHIARLQRENSDLKERLQNYAKFGNSEQNAFEIAFTLKKEKELLEQRLHAVEELIEPLRHPEMVVRVKELRKALGIILD